MPGVRPLAPAGPTTPETLNHRFFTYNAELRPWDVKGLWDNYRQKDLNSDLIMLYGWGDGGGGPTEEMLEGARVYADLGRPVGFAEPPPLVAGPPGDRPAPPPTGRTA